MPKYIALLRGINVAGQKLIKMDALKLMFAEAGATDVSTYIQSGNVAFSHPENDAKALRQHIEQSLASQLGYHVPTYLRNLAQIEAVLAGNPFPLDLPNFGKKVYVGFFESGPNEAQIAAIQPYVTEIEKLVIKGEECYLHYAEGLGKSKLTNAVLERRLGAMTLRNWNTVNKLHAMLS